MLMTVWLLDFVETFSIHPFLSFNLAAVLLIAGKILTLNLADLPRDFSSICD